MKTKYKIYYAGHYFEEVETLDQAEEYIETICDDKEQLIKELFEIKEIENGNDK